MSWIESTPNGVLIRLRVVPNASKNEVSGTHGNSLKIRIQTPPADGKANRTLIKFLSKTIGVSKASVSIVKGLKSRDKQIAVLGVDPDLIGRRLGLPITH